MEKRTKPAYDERLRTLEAFVANLNMAGMALPLSETFLHTKLTELIDYALMDVIAEDDKINAHK